MWRAGAVHVSVTRHLWYTVHMALNDTIDELKALAPLLAPRGVTGLSIFGSRATGTYRTDSDLDVILDYDPESHFSLIDLVAVSRIIEDRTGFKADVMTRRGLHPVIKHDIETQAIRVY